MNACGRAARLYRAGLFMLALVLGLTGCAAVSPPIPAPEAPARPWDSREMIESLSRRQEQFRSIRALARVEYAGPEGKRGFQEAVLVERPGRLRLETLSFLGTIYVVTVDDGELIGHDTREGLWVRGEGTKENLLRLTKIGLEIEEITALLLGLPPIRPDAAWRQEGNSLVFAAPGAAVDVVSFEAAQPVPTRWQRINRQGQVELSAIFADYSNTEAGLFPGRIRLDSAPQKRRLELSYQSPELNVAIPPEAFSQRKPGHVTEIPIEALGT